MLILFFFAIVAGVFGALLGIGGGIIIVPALTLFFEVPIHHAVAASLVSVIATSIAGAQSYLEQEITDVRLGTFLQMATAAGALAGAFTGVLLEGWVLALVFSGFLFYIAYSSFRSRDHSESAQESENSPSDFLAAGSYYDQSLRQQIHYRPQRPVAGSLVAVVAGISSGMLGIGGGAIKVGAMNQMMKVPVKVSVATSKFMIGITASVSAIVYLVAKAVDLHVVAPVALGTMAGATLGSLVMNRIPPKVIKTMLAVLLLYIGWEMLGAGLEGGWGIELPSLGKGGGEGGANG